MYQLPCSEGVTGVAPVALELVPLLVAAAVATLLVDDAATGVVVEAVAATSAPLSLQLLMYQVWI